MPLPSVLLHDHLDGGLRPETLIDLARERGYDRLPSFDPSNLAEWFDQSSSGSLERYLEAFVHTIGLMQDVEALERVAYEAVLDLAEDGVVYAEVRFCPGLHTKGTLRPVEVVESVRKGMARGSEETGMSWGLIVDGLRQTDNPLEMARVAEAAREMGVVAFDLAGSEAGHPPRSHLAAFRQARASGLRVTIHAGEAAGADGPAFIAEAMDLCGAERIGHGVELIDDCLVEDGEVTKLGPVARRVRDRQMVLEMCPASNMATGRLTPDSHPIGSLYRAGFNVTVNTDNRLMSSTSMRSEIAFLQRSQGFSDDDIARITRKALAGAFCDHDLKRELWEDVIAPAHLSAGAGVSATWDR